MKMRLEDKKRAIELRQEGFTYNEIRNFIPDLSKGTLSGWLKNIELSFEQKKRILNKIKDGSKISRLKGSWTNKNKAALRINKINKIAFNEYEALAKDGYFRSGLSLYWAEGAKKSRIFQFMNSDPKIIRFMIKWLCNLLKVPKEDVKIRIFIHKVYEHENCEEYWSKVTGISVSEFKKTIYKPTIHTIKKNPSYKGCCRIEITKSEIYWKISKWIEMLGDEFSLF